MMTKMMLPQMTVMITCLRHYIKVLICLFSEHFLVAVPVAVVAAVGGFLVSQYLNRRSCKKGQVNTCINKDSPKVVHSFDMEDIAIKAVYCRCWKSKKVGPQAAINVL